MQTKQSQLSEPARVNPPGADPAATPNPELQAAIATEKALRELLALSPEDSFLHFKLGQFLAEQRRTDEAATHYGHALRLQPRFPEALRNLAALHAAKRDFPGALDLLQRAIAIRPDDVQALSELGNALVKLRRAAEAIPIFRHAIRLLPSESGLHNNLGLAFLELGRFEEAEKAFADALQITPMLVSAHNNLGNLYIAMGRFGEACSCFHLAGIIDPNHVKTKCNRALALLSMGDYQRGWQEYQWRWHRPETPHRSCPEPLWNGEPLADEGGARRILIYTDEGLGDRIQFIRYAPMLKQLGAHVLFECPMPLIDVMKSVPGVDELITLGDALPPFDVHVPLMSLPYLFKTTLATVPAQVPYLAAEPERLALWRSRLAQTTTPDEFLIGIAWQGNPHHQWDRFRSMRLMQLEPLTRIPGVRLVSLQRGPGTEQISTFQRLTRHDLLVPTDGQQTTPGDLADSAAIMAHLDLIITVDTATAHLAGALARPVWVALSKVSDWRWMADRHDTPWYPTMRLFRQQRLDDWDELVMRMLDCIQTMKLSPHL